MRLRRKTLNTLLMVMAGVICTVIGLFIFAILSSTKHRDIQRPKSQPIKPIILDYYTGIINEADAARLKLSPSYVNQPWESLAVALVQYYTVTDPNSVNALFAYEARKKAAEAAEAAAAADPKRKKDKDKNPEPVFSESPPALTQTTLNALVEGKFLERQLDMEFLTLEPGLFGSPWRVQHLDRDPPTTEAAVQKADPYFEVYLNYKDGQASLGPVWVVNVETGAVMPRNDLARLFQLSPDKPNQTDDFRQDLVKVVKLLSNHQFDSGMQLGSFLLQNFVSRNQACRDAQKRKLQDAAARPITCDNDRIIGWTVNHLLDDDNGREYLAYFQWIENNRILTARWQVVLKKNTSSDGDSKTPPFSFRPAGLLALDLMKEAESYCPGNNPTELPDDRLQRLIGFDLYTPDAKPITDDTTTRPEWKEICRKVIETPECSGGVFISAPSCDPERVSCCKVSEPGKSVEISVSSQNPEALKRLYSAIKAHQTGKTADVFISSKKEFSARQGPLWPEDYDTNFDIWRDGSRTAALMENPAAKPIITAFATTLREGDFVMAVQDLLSSQEDVLIDKAACAKAELAFQQTLKDAGSEGDLDGDGLIDTADNCPSVPNPDQRDGFSHEKGVAPGQGNGVGDACDCRWGPSVVVLSDEEKAQAAITPRTQDAFRVVYQYRRNDETKTVGFFILTPAAPPPAETDPKDKKDKDKEEPIAAPASPPGKTEVIPIDSLSEWAFWSVNPRNLKGGQDKARLRLPSAATAPKP